MQHYHGAIHPRRYCGNVWQIPREKSKIRIESAAVEQRKRLDHGSSIARGCSRKITCSLDDFFLNVRNHFFYSTFKTPNMIKHTPKRIKINFCNDILSEIGRASCRERE